MKYRSSKGYFTCGIRIPSSSLETWFRSY